MSNRVGKNNRINLNEKTIINPSVKIKYIDNTRFNKGNLNSDVKPGYK